MNRPDPILLVEDNPDDVFFMNRACRQAEIVQSLQVVENGRAAIDYLSGTGEFADRAKYVLPCLILLDLKLPYKSGADVLQWIRESETLRNLPVIILTTSAEQSDVERAYRLGANAFLVKPANMNDLIRMLKTLKAFWLEYNVLPQIRPADRPIAAMHIR